MPGRCRRAGRPPPPWPGWPRRAIWATCRKPDLAPLTAAATVFAYPSLYEGFGFPVAQAMAAGVPVITSNVSSLPEIAGDAALLMDPRSPAELRDGLARLLLSPGLRADLGARGRSRAPPVPLGSMRGPVAAFL